MDNEYKYNELVEKKYKYDISLSFNTGALFATAQKTLDEINSIMQTMMADSGKLIARSNGFEMNLTTSRKLTDEEKGIMSGHILTSFEDTFPKGEWRIDSFDLVEYTEHRI